MQFVFGVPRPFDPEKEKDRVDRLIKIVGNPKDYEIFISGDIDDAKEVRKREKLFSSVERLCNDLGHKPFCLIGLLVSGERRERWSLEILMF